MKYYAKGLPWASGIGKDVSDCITSREVIEKVGLDFDVKKCELVARMPFNIAGNNDLNEDDFIHKGQIFRNCPNAFATYRTDYNIPLGIVKARYEVIQNVDAFEFFNDAIEDGNAEWTKAGIFGVGQKIFITAKIKNSMDINGDHVDNYLVFSNSHDGSQSIDIMFTPIRVACTNMLNGARQMADVHIRIRHTKTAKEKLEEASRVLRIACEYSEKAAETFKYLTTVQMSDIEVIKYFCKLILSDAEFFEVGKLNNWGFEGLLHRNSTIIENAGISTRKVNQIVSMYDYYKHGVAQEDIVGTAWGAYNAVTGYYCNVANLSGEKRMNSLLYGNAANVTAEALAMVA